MGSDVVSVDLDQSNFWRLYTLKENHEQTKLMIEPISFNMIGKIFTMESFPTNLNLITLMGQ